MAPERDRFVATLPQVAAHLVARALDDDQSTEKRSWDSTRHRFLSWEEGSVRPLSEDSSATRDAATPRDLPLGGLLAASADCSAVASLTFDRLVTAAGARKTAELPCAPGWRDRLVVGTVAFPFADRRVVAVIATDDPARHRLLIIDASIGGLLHHDVLESDRPAGFSIYGHPSGSGCVIDCGGSTDGAELWTVTDAGGELSAQPAPRRGRAFGAFSPDGSQALTIRRDGAALEIVSWPDWTACAAPAAVAAFGGGPAADRFDRCAAYLTPQRILAKSAENGDLVVVDCNTGEATQRLVLPGIEPAPGGAGPLEWFTRIGRRRLITRSWRNGRSSIETWELPKVLLVDHQVDGR